ncbi:ABC transporter ATP-binding protein [Candidatus Acetothermia bacterium]|nr:ABC transporter ATP-binding protein [Candidatus Acetothermia bacterium]MBI3643921.1 ABC transporter ATP-binding protein [Candidatus Acetothermia bacterium]
MLKLENLAASYGSRLVLQGINLEVWPGEVVGILGRNGAGKTTAIKTILGLVPIKSGRVCFENQDLASMTPHHIPRLGIGVVPQGNRIFPNLTVQENLQLIPDKTSADDERFRHAIERFPQIRERLHQRAGTLSGGEQQMLSIARAQLMNSKLMLLDEPLEGLMPSLIVEVERWIGELRARSAGVLWAEQRTESAIRLCDRIYVLNQGRVVCEGIPSSLNKSDLKRHFGLGVQ